jgi:hypothetical protein
VTFVLLRKVYERPVISYYLLAAGQVQVNFLRLEYGSYRSA